VEARITGIDESLLMNNKRKTRSGYKKDKG
jgi:hypothetical protein